MKKIKRILLIVLLIIVASACSAQPTQIIEPAFTQSPGSLPGTEDEIPRVTIEDARAALDSGAAIIVDVRDPAEYEKSHVAGAVSIWLDEIEANPTGLNLDKDQWIITYCT